MTRNRRTAGFALFAYLVCIGILVFAASLTDLGIPQATQSALGQLQATGRIPGVRYGHVEAMANVLVFVPIGLLLTTLFRRSLWWIATVTSAAMSLSIEAIQWVALMERNPSFRDVVCNSLGALVGSGVAAIFARNRRPLRLRPGAADT